MSDIKTFKVILAIDPGGTTGLAWYLQDGIYLTATADSAEKVWEEIDPTSVDTVLYEQFSASIISKHGLHTVRVVGGIQALCMYHKIPCIARTAQSRIAFLDDAKDILKYQPGPKTPHQRDALAHILSYQHEVRIYGRHVSPSRPKKASGELEHYERSHA